MKTATPKQIARVFGCTTEQAVAQLRRNADSIRRYSDADLKRWGRTREESVKVAIAYELAAHS